MFYITVKICYWFKIAYVVFKPKRLPLYAKMFVARNIFLLYHIVILIIYVLTLRFHNTFPLRQCAFINRFLCGLIHIFPWYACIILYILRRNVVAWTLFNIIFKSKWFYLSFKENVITFLNTKFREWFGILTLSRG